MRVALAIAAGLLALLGAAWIIGFVGGAIFGCSRPAPASGPTDTSIYSALVEAGCLAASDDGVSFVIAEHSLPDTPAWLSCLYSGGSVSTCKVPCE
jgi:hypothetical protein